MFAIIENIRMLAREETRNKLIRALAGDSRDVFDYCVQRVMAKPMQNVMIYGTAIWNQDRAASLIVHWYIRLLRIKQQYNANPTEENQK